MRNYLREAIEICEEKLKYAENDGDWNKIEKSKEVLGRLMSIEQEAFYIVENIGINQIY